MEGFFFFKENNNVPSESGFATLKKQQHIFLKLVNATSSDKDGWMYR